ncbi:hypothetical protein KFK09_000615 [Dendrobium nobile]|uniref:Uncharacterized protein n=1 Tax=Dendrobium nobile TaxID=94219 RepID=A0A8T3CC19_DENNO|nr:hypothetical protein KFK09_000615 [Dendrobium nobile]
MSAGKSAGRSPKIQTQSPLAVILFVNLSHLTSLARRLPSSFFARRGLTSPTVTGLHRRRSPDFAEHLPLSWSRTAEHPSTDRRHLLEDIPWCMIFVDDILLVDKTREGVEVMDVITRHLLQDVPWCMLFVDDILLVDKTREGVEVMDVITRHLPLPTPGASSSQFYSPDPRFPSPDPGQSTPFYPYYTPPPYAGAPPTYPFPPYAPPYYPPPLHQPATAGPSTTATAEQEIDGRMLIAPEGDTFYSSKQPTHKIRDIIWSRFDAPYVSWKKVPKEVREMWFREFEKEMLGREPTPVELHSRTHKRQEDQQLIDERARKAHEEYTRLRETHAASGEGSSGGSVEYSEYRIWSQAVGEMQHGRVYDLAELEQVRKSQADWQAQLQAQVQAQLQAQVQTSTEQHNQLLDEMRKMREQLSGKDVAPPEEESTESE